MDSVKTLIPNKEYMNTVLLQAKVQGQMCLI